MKVILALIPLFVLSFCHGQDRQIGKVTKGGIEILVDTASLKKDISKLFIDESEKTPLIHFQIKKKWTIGSKRQEYYFISVEGPGKHLTIARKVYRKGNKLYLRDNTDDPLAAMYIFCEGADDCGPNIFNIDGKLNWGCGESGTCFPDTAIVTCKTSKRVNFE
jgi:hypothetical protein